LRGKLPNDTLKTSIIARYMMANRGVHKYLQGHINGFSYSMLGYLVSIIEIRKFTTFTILNVAG